MKKLLLSFGILVLNLFMVAGQNLHTMDEIIKIMEKSTVSYSLNKLESKIIPPDRSEDLNYNNSYRVIKDSSIYTYSYKIDSTTKAYFDEAEAYFQASNYSQAKKMYLKAYESDHSFYKVLTYVGQICGIEGDNNKAIEWYKKTISLNYIDYMAHWFLANAYKRQGKYDDAVEEITIAMILNRNNPRIKKAFDEIYALKKYKTSDWVFNPQIKIDSTGENEVSISYGDDWLGYAMVKALWKYEPGYRESMGVNNRTLTTLEERECFLGLLVSLDKKKIKKYPEFAALRLAVDKRMITEFIFYEVFLLDHPFVANQLSEEFINDIKDYVIQVRGIKK